MLGSIKSMVSRVKGEIYLTYYWFVSKKRLDNLNSTYPFIQPFYQTTFWNKWQEKRISLNTITHQTKPKSF